MDPTVMLLIILAMMLNVLALVMQKGEKEEPEEEVTLTAADRLKLEGESYED